MATTQPNVYISTFERILRQLAQQAITKLRPHVTERSSGGKDHAWERLASSNALLKSTRLTATPTADTAWSRRLSVAKTYHNADSTEQEDLVQMLIDPNSNLAQSLAMSIRREWDREILKAGMNAALDGDGVTTIALPAAQIIGTAGVAINFDLVTECQEKFMDNDIDPDVPKVMIVPPVVVRKLMQLTEQTSGDFVSREALMRLSSSGIVPNWMGFTWINSTQIAAVAAGLDTPPAGGDTFCMAMTMRGVGMQMNRDMLVRVAEDPSVSFAYRIYCESTFGAVRVEDEHVVRLDVLNGV